SWSALRHPAWRICPRPWSGALPLESLSQAEVFFRARDASSYGTRSEVALGHLKTASTGTAARPERGQDLRLRPNAAPPSAMSPEPKSKTVAGDGTSARSDLTEKS